MASFGYNVNGSSVVIRETLKLSATIASGVPVVVNAAGGAGIAVATTTTWTDAIGVTVDGGTYSTTQGVGVEGTASVLVNPTAAFKWRISGSATEGTQALIVTNSAASATGLTITITTGDVAPNSPSMDEGTAYCVSGANAGQSRKITSVTATTAVVTVPFEQDLAVGDVFLLLPWTPYDVAGNNVQFSTALTEADQSIVVGTGAAVRITRLSFAPAPDGRINSYVYGIADDHILNVTT